METRELSPEEYYTVIRPAEVCRMVNFSDRHLRRLEKEGKFPHRFKLSPGTGQQGAAGNFLGYVVDYLKARAAESEGGANHDRTSD